MVRQAFQRDQRAHHGIAPVRRRVIAIRAPPGPFGPEPLGLLEAAKSIGRPRRGAIGGVVVEDERHARTLADAELADRREILAAQIDLGAQLQSVRARDRADAEILPPHPRHHAAVAEAHDQLGAHPHLAAHALDDADQIDMLGIVAARHEVDHERLAFVGLEAGLEDRRAGAVAAPGPPDLALRRDQPAAVLGRTQQGCKAGIRIEARQAKPVDRAVPPDQRPGHHVADEAIALDRLAQARTLWINRQSSRCWSKSRPAE